MKFQVAKSDFLFALNTVSSAKSSTEGDISSHFVFRLEPGTTDKVQILAGSNRVYAHCTIPKAIVKEEGESFTIEGWRLLGWLNNVGDVAVDVETMADAEVQIKAGKMSQRFRSLDAANFQYVDKILATATTKGKIAAKRLSKAFTSAKNFASTDESNKSDVVVIDIKDGLLTATDKTSVLVFITLQDFADVSMRIHVKDIGSIANFLNPIGDDEIEILDAKRTVFMKRLSDGAVLGETRFQNNFPTLNPPDDTDQRVWSINVSELRKAAQHGFYGAKKDDDRLYLHAPETDGTMKVSMLTDTNTGGSQPLSITATETINDPNAEAVPATGFPVSYPHILALLDAFPGDATIEIGVNVNAVKRKRFLRVTKQLFVDEKDNTKFDKYVFVLAGLVW